MEFGVLVLQTPKTDTSPRVLKIFPDPDIIRGECFITGQGGKILDRLGGTGHVFSHNTTNAILDISPDIVAQLPM